MSKGKGLRAIYRTSSALSGIVGFKEGTRPEVTRAVWAYIKENDLQDEDDKRIIVPDHQLKSVLGSRPVHMLKLQGFLNKHLEPIE